MNAINKKNIYRWSLIVLGLIAYYYIFNKLILFKDWDSIDYLLTNRSHFLLIILLQLFLSIFNWSLDIIKWHLLIRSLTTQSLFLSIKQFFRGYSLGSLTPARLGDPVGRLVNTPREKRLSILSVAYFGGIIQTILIIAIGLLVLTIISIPNSLIQPIKFLFDTGFETSIIIALIIITLLLAAFKYLGIDSLNKWKHKIASSIKLIPNYIWVNYSILTLLRYLLFSTQLTIWLLYFSSSTTYTNILPLVFIYYFFVASIPSFILTELGIRGSIALLIFSSTITNPIIIIISVFFIWTINVGIPTLVGATLYIVSHKYKAKE